VAGDQRQALVAGVEPDALQDPPDAVLGDPDASPLVAAQLGRDPPRAVARVPEREGDHLLLEVGSDLVRHPRPAPLADPQRLEPPAVCLLLEPVVGRAVDAHRPAGGGDVAELLGQREQPQAIAEERVIMGHARLLRVLWKTRD
jgi:hypothetical protein